MKTYKVQVKDGFDFEVKNVVTVWTSENGVNFSGENDQHLAFVPYQSLAAYYDVENTEEHSGILNSF